MKISVKVTILVTHQNKILLIQEYLEKRGGYFWNLIKGTYGDVEGESLLEAAIRECQEEAGLDVKITGFFDFLQVQKKDETKIQFNFLGETVSAETKLAEKTEQEQRAEAIAKAQWFAPDEIEKLPGEILADPHILHLVKKYKEKKYRLVSDSIVVRK